MCFEDFQSLPDLKSSVNMVIAPLLQVLRPPRHRVEVIYMQHGMPRRDPLINQLQTWICSHQERAALGPPREWERKVNV